MIQNIDFALGFFITIIFLASVVVILTMVYFSRPKPKDQSAKNELGREKSKISEGKSQSVTKVKHNQTRSESTVGDSKSLGEPTIPEANIEIPAKTTIPAEKTTLDATKSVSETAEDSKNANKTEVLSSNSLPDEKQSGAQASPRAEKPRPQETTPGKENTPIGTLPNLAAPVEPVTIKPLKEEKTVSGPTNTKPGKDVKPAVNVEPAIPPVQIENENEGKIQMEDKSKDLKPDGDFSDLFAEELEENEASILAKELNDIDTEDILQTSQSLISQLRRNRNSQVANNKTR